MRLILASTSVYRKRLLDRLGIPFTSEAPGVDEGESGDLPGEILAPRLAEAKAEAVLGKFPDACVLGSDQIACLDGECFGKPGSEKAAVEQLERLCGKTHFLYTAVSLRTAKESFSHLDVTRLTMGKFDRKTLEAYVRRDNPVDCAGSYKIESAGISLFETVETKDPTAIEGLPLTVVSRWLRTLGLLSLLFFATNARAEAELKKSVNRIRDAVSSGKFRTNGCKAIPPEKLLQLILLNQPVDHEWKFGKGCDAEGKLSLRRTTFPVDLRVRNIPDTDRIRAVVEPDFTPDFTNREIKIFVKAKEGVLSDKAKKELMGATVDFLAVVAMDGTVKDKGHGTIAVDRYRGKSVSYKEEFKLK